MCVPNECDRNDVKQIVNYAVSVLPSHTLPFDPKDLLLKGNVECQEEKKLDSFAITAL